MVFQTGKYEKREPVLKKRCPYLLLPLAFFLVEVFAFAHLQPAEGPALAAWPLVFGVLWAVILGCLPGLFPRKAGRLLFGMLYGGVIVYAVGQTGYYHLFSEMMWLSEFRYASEGADYLDVILSYPLDWFVWIFCLLTLGAVLIWKYPNHPRRRSVRVGACSLVLAAVTVIFLLPQQVFARDSDIRYAKSDYGRMQSAEAAYENMFNTHRLYQVCGIYQTVAKDVARNLLPKENREEVEEARETIGEFFQEETMAPVPVNAMTGILKDKNVILVLMESMDDWMIGEHTPNIRKLMSEGINFTNFYTPPYGGIRTFNTEFCINTGSFLSSQGGYAFDYVTNAYNQSLASLLRQEGYSAKTFHYNDPSFYSRGVFSESMGYEEYVYYGDYLTGYSEKEQKQLLYDEQILFDEPGLRQEFFREGKTLNFLITRSAHLSYKYNEVLSHWALQQYPEYRGMTGNEETDCALVKARLVDDLFGRLMTELEKEGHLQDTVIIGVTDHYTYGYKEEAELMKLSNVDNKLLLEKTPCFIWSQDLSPAVVEKTLNTSDLLPTILNLMGMESPHAHLGSDAFDEDYEGYALFANGSWITDGIAYDAATKKILYLEEDIPPVTKEQREKMDTLVDEFITINNLILEADYYEE